MAGAHCQHHQLDLLVVVVPLEVCGVEALTPGIRGALMPGVTVACVYIPYARKVNPYKA